MYIMPCGNEMGLSEIKSKLFDEIRNKVDTIGDKAIKRNLGMNIGDLDVLIATLVDMDLIIKKPTYSESVRNYKVTGSQIGLTGDNAKLFDKIFDRVQEKGWLSIDQGNEPRDIDVLLVTLIEMGYLKKP